MTGSGLVIGLAATSALLWVGVVLARRMFAGMARRDRSMAGPTPAMLRPVDDELARVVDELYRSVEVDKARAVCATGDQPDGAALPLAQAGR